MKPVEGRQKHNEEAFMKRLVTSKVLKVWLLFFVLTLPLFLSGCGTGSGSLPTFNVTGSWFIYHTTAATAGVQGPDLYAFTTSESSLSGTVTPAGQTQAVAVTGNVKGVNISFSWTWIDGTVYAYEGTVGANATMSGKWTSLKGQTVQSGTWNALTNNTNLPTSSIAGNWNIFVTTAGITGEAGPNLVTFTQSGNNISATLQGQTITATGSVSNLNILFFWIGSDGVTTNLFVGAVTATDAGTVIANTMSGTWTSTNGQSGTWRATKSN